MKIEKGFFFIISTVLFYSCVPSNNQLTTYTTSGKAVLDTNQIWLTHEHILVDFIGANNITSEKWDLDTVQKHIIPYFDKLIKHQVNYFVDATPNFLGRDVLLLDKIAKKTGIQIITNTGFYGAGNNKYIPNFGLNLAAKEIAKIWIKEFTDGIAGTNIRPGFIKIGVDTNDPLMLMHNKLIEAAAITHLKTGLTIASHTGEAKGLWPQLKVLKQMGVSPEAFIWVHAQQESDFENMIKAANLGCWISIDGFGWETDDQIQKILLAKENQFLNRILISHDAGWFDPQKSIQDIKPYTNIFEVVIPKLKSHGFTTTEIDLLLKVNPAKAFSLNVNRINH